MTDIEKEDIARVADLMKKPNMIFVFGSNLSGRHGKGAALEAKQKWGAIGGWPFGMQGRSFAIPTKNENILALSLPKIATYVKNFIGAASIPVEGREFAVTRIGCGLAGYDDTDIAPLFSGAGENVHLPTGWREIIADWEEAGRE